MCNTSANFWDEMFLSQMLPNLFYFEQHISPISFDPDPLFVIGNHLLVIISFTVIIFMCIVPFGLLLEKA